MMTHLPTFKELPNFKEFTGCAWGVWPEDDELGTVNLLTEDVVLQAAKEEIRTGKAVSLNWPLNFPEKPMFHRKTPEVTQVLKLPEYTALRDAILDMNSQSGTQWDGMKHFGILEHHVFYKGIKSDTLPLGRHAILDPLNVDPKLTKLGIQNWAKHGICGRGVLLDLVDFFTESGTKPLPYDPLTTHAVTVGDLQACATKQGVKFRQGDILIMRVGFISKYNTIDNEGRAALGAREETFAGLDQGEEMKAFLWDNHFAAVASDQPALERWPAPENKYLHQTILGLWGMPIGEFFDLEELSKTCKELNRYTFYFSSWPLPIIGGCASPANASATF